MSPPVELLRNQLMMQGVGGPRRYYSAVDVLRHCWVVSGRRPTFVVMRFYAALPVTLARDSLGMANYFSGFFHMTQVQYARHTSPSAGVTRHDVRRRFNKLGVDNSFARGSYCSRVPAPACYSGVSRCRSTASRVASK